MFRRLVSHAILVASIGAGAMPFLSAPAFAAEWSMLPTLKLGYELNDNYRMTSQPHNTVQGTTVVPKLDLGVQSEVWQLMGTFQATRKRYSGEEGLDRDNKLYSLSSNYRTERNFFAISASRVDDAVISDELEDPDVGLVTVQTSRRTESVQPTWRWMMTERAQIQLGYQLTEASYANGQSNGFYDYQWRNASAIFSYQISPLSQFFLTANHSTYRVPSMSLASQIPANPQFISAALDVDSRTQSFRTGFSYIFSETTQATLQLGMRKTTRDQTVQQCVPIYFLGVFVGYDCSSPPVDQSLESSGPSYSGDLQKKFEKYALTASGSRDITASGSGTESDTSSLRVKIDRPYTARLRGSLTATGGKTRYLSSTTSNDRTHYSIEPRLNWILTREADISLAYRYIHLKREGEDQAVESNAMFLTLVYAWPKISVSR